MQALRSAGCLTHPLAGESKQARARLRVSESHSHLKSTPLRIIAGIHVHHRLRDGARYG